MKSPRLSAVVAVLFALSCSLSMTPAEAARLGGGKSFGMSRSVPRSAPAAPPPKPATPTQNAAPAAAPTPATAPAPARSGMSRWLGPIAGLAAGIGLAAMLSHFGMGEGAANLLMIALLVFAGVALLRFLFRSKTTAPQPTYAGAGYPNVQPLERRLEPVTADAIPAAPQLSQVCAGGTANPAPPILPADFDSAGFLRQAKLNFVRLQAANDRGDMADIREFVAPEVFAEIQMQYEERGKASQQTDVVKLDAELLALATEAERHIASVRFFGQLREQADAPPQAFDEVWHLSKPLDGSRGWIVAGIEQQA